MHVRVKRLFQNIFFTVWHSRARGYLLQDRLPVNVFIRHYWSPKLAELRDRIFKAIEPIDVQQQINSE
jgi:hypothetical protein